MASHANGRVEAELDLTRNSLRKTMTVAGAILPLDTSFFEMVDPGHMATDLLHLVHIIHLKSFGGYGFTHLWVSIPSNGESTALILITRE